MRQATLLVAFAVLFLGLVLGFGAGQFNAVAVAGIFGVAIAMGAFLDLRITLVFIVPAMVLLPELPLSIPLRTEDLLMGPLAAAWLARVAMGRSRLPHTPLNRPLLLLIFVELVSTLAGALRGTADLSARLYGGTFFFLKTVEVTFLFLITISVIEDRRDLKVFTGLFAASGAVLGLWGLWQRGYLPEGMGVFGPAGPMGYSLLGLTYVVLLAALGGLALSFPRGKGQWLLGGAALPILAALPFTLSRQSYVGAAVVLLVLLWVRDRRLILPALVLALLIPRVLPRAAQERAASIVTREAPSPFGGEPRDPYATRLRALVTRGPEVLQEAPLFGLGLAALPPGFLDNQYLLTLYYTGLVGLVVFLWVLVRAGRTALTLFRFERGPYRGLSLGWLAATLGLGLAGLAGSPFVAVRVRQAYWFLAALSLAAGRLAVREIRARMAAQEAAEEAATGGRKSPEGGAVPEATGA